MAEYRIKRRGQPGKDVALTDVQSKGQAKYKDPQAGMSLV